MSHILAGIIFMLLGIFVFGFGVRAAFESASGDLGPFPTIILVMGGAMGLLLLITGM